MHTTNTSRRFWVRVKRTIYITSLYLRLIREYQPKPGVLEECNRLFKLVNDTNALRLPAILAPRVWREETVRCAMGCYCAGDLDRAVSTLCQRSPHWLHYQDERAMQRDTRRVLRVTRHRMAEGQPA